MGLFLHTVLFPGGDEAECRAALAREAEDPELAIRPEECRWHTFEEGPAVFLNDGAVGYEAAGRMSGASDGGGLDCPVMGLYIYDGDFWGYELWQRGRELDRSCSLPDYFGEGELPDGPGDAEIVGRCFGVDPERIRRYLVPWTEEAGGAYAYDGDGAAVGDSWQMADFMDALGFDLDLLFPPPGPGEEPPRPAPPQEPPPPPPSAKGRGRAEDTPILPDVLNSPGYALQRALELGEGYEDLPPLLQCGEYQEAASRLTEAIQAAPEEAGAYLVRAFCWKQLERLSGRSRKMELDRDLTKALELEPDDIMALRGRCSLTTTSARYPRQIQDLGRLMELDAEARDLYQVSRAYYRHWLRDDEGARADLRQVLDRGELWTVDLVYLCTELGLLGP